MRKLKVIEYKVDENLNPIEFERDIFLHYSAKSVLLYEQMTGNKFYDDFNKAVRKLKTIEDGINKKKSDNATFNLLIDNVTTPEVVNFLIGVIPALYAEIHEGKFLQNEITYDSALNSDWLMDVANFETLTTLIDEVTSNISGEKNQSKKKPERMNQPVLTSIT